MLALHSSIRAVHLLQKMFEEKVLTYAPNLCDSDKIPKLELIQMRKTPHPKDELVSLPMLTE